MLKQPPVGTPRTAFTAEQYALPYPDGIEDNYWNVARNRIVARCLEELGVAKTDRVLDIGCGRGITVDFLRRRGFDAWGSEVATPEPISASVAPFLRLGADAFELPDDERRRIRTILLLDVLEHLEEPTAFLERCRERFEGCDRIVVTLPARMELWSNYDEYYGHLHRYRTEDIRSLVPAGAFEVERQGYFFRLLYPPARLVKLLGRDRAVEIRAPKPASRWAHRVLGAVLELEERLLPGRLAGTSMLVALRVVRRA